MPIHICRWCQRPVNVTEDEKREMQQEWLAGTGVTEIARNHKVTRKTVYAAVEAVRFPEEPGQGVMFQ